MRFIPPSRWPIPIALAVAGGLLIGLSPLQELAAARGWQVGLVNFAIINLLLPLLAVALGILYPRVGIALTAGVELGFGFWLGRLLGRDYHIWLWTPGWIFSVTHPILLLAIPGYGLIASIAAAAATPFRRVGLPDEHQRCRHCGYLQAGNPGDICPECGKESALAKIERTPRQTRGS